MSGCLIVSTHKVFIVLSQIHISLCIHEGLGRIIAIATLYSGSNSTNDHWLSSDHLDVYLRADLMDSYLRVLHNNHINMAYGHIEMATFVGVIPPPECLSFSSIIAIKYHTFSYSKFDNYLFCN